MDRKAQTEVVVAALGMVFGLMLAPIPNLASEFVLSGILGQMDAHMARQEAGIDAVQITTPTGPHSYSFNPTTSRIQSNTRDVSGLYCISSPNPGGNRSVEFGGDIDFASDQCNLIAQGDTNAYELGYPPEISFAIEDTENLELPEDEYPNPGNSILLDTGVESD